MNNTKLNSYNQGHWPHDLHELKEKGKGKRGKGKRGKGDSNRDYSDDKP